MLRRRKQIVVNNDTNASRDPRNEYLGKFAPGLAKLLRYQKTDLPHDLLAGLSVAAVALPIGVAYAQLAGFNPAVGLYSTILPLIAYAIFGTSRQLIVGPDAATCALITAALVPLSSGDVSLYESLSEVLALFAGLLCIGASFFRLGALADFLSKPILVGFLNGVALSIILGQLGKIFGYSISSGGIVPRLVEFVNKLGVTHWPTLAVGLGTFMVLFVVPRFLRRVPAALVAIILASAAVRLLSLEEFGVKTVGEVPAGLPSLRIPHVPLSLIPSLFGDAAGLVLVTFSSMMLTSRSFASKNRYDIDANREFAALGAANITSALSGGFAVSGADSRTAMSDATGGRTQVTGLVAAATVAVVLSFFTQPLRYLPIAALGAVLVKAALSLVDLESLKSIYRIDRKEFALAIFSILAVVAVGAIRAILIAVTVALLRFVRIVSRPKVEILGKVDESQGFHSIERHSDAVTVPGLMLVRFNSPIVFFNAPYFKQEVLAIAKAAGPSLRWLVLDMLPITMIDATGIYTVAEVADLLREQSVVLAAAGRQTEWRLWAKSRRGVLPDGKIPRYSTVGEAVKAFERSPAGGPPAPQTQDAFRSRAAGT